MREVVTRTWCDLHDARDGVQVETDGSSDVILVNARPVTLDLCDQCRKELLQPLQDLMDSHGARYTGDEERLMRRTRAPLQRTYSPPPSATDQVTCPACEKTMLRGTIRQHARIHGVDVVAPIGHCPVKGCSQTFDDPRAMATHRRGTHNYDVVADTLQQLAAIG